MSRGMKERAGEVASELEQALGPGEAAVGGVQAKTSKERGEARSGHVSEGSLIIVPVPFSLFKTLIRPAAHLPHPAPPRHACGAVSGGAGPLTTS